MMALIWSTRMNSCIIPYMSIVLKETVHNQMKPLLRFQPSSTNYPSLQCYNKACLNNHGMKCLIPWATMS